MNFKDLAKILTNKFKTVVVIFIVTSFVSSHAFAQQGQSSTQIGPKKQLTMIFLAGLGGAVLGLSTLSFHGRPQDHLGNIAIGFAIGAVFGTVYVTYNTATKPKQYLSDLDNPLLLNPTKRESVGLKSTPSLVSYNFSF